MVQEITTYQPYNILFHSLKPFPKETSSSDILHWCSMVSLGATHVVYEIVEAGFRIGSFLQIRQQMEKGRRLGSRRPKNPHQGHASSFEILSPSALAASICWRSLESSRSLVRGVTSLMGSKDVPSFFFFLFSQSGVQQRLENRVQGLIADHNGSPQFLEYWMPAELSQATTLMADPRLLIIPRANTTNLVLLLERD